MISGLSWFAAAFGFPSAVAWLASGDKAMGLFWVMMVVSYIGGALGFEDTFLRATQKADQVLQSILPRWIWVGLFLLLALGSFIVFLIRIRSPLHLEVTWPMWAYVVGNMVLALGGFAWAVLLCWLGEHFLQRKVARQESEAM